MSGEEEEEDDEGEDGEQVLQRQIKRQQSLTQISEGCYFVHRHTCISIRASHIISSVTSSVTSGATSSDSRSRGKDQTLTDSFTLQLWQLRSTQPFEARSQPKLGDRGRDERPWMNGHQTARADMHLNPAAGFEELMELLSLISACVGGLSSSFYLPSVCLQRSNTHLGAQTCVKTHTRVASLLGSFLTASATKQEVV